MEIPDVQDVAHPDASDGHALEGDQAAEVVNLEEEKEFNTKALHNNKENIAPETPVRLGWLYQRCHCCTSPTPVTQLAFLGVPGKLSALPRGNF